MLVISKISFAAFIFFSLGSLLAPPPPSAGGIAPVGGGNWGLGGVACVIGNVCIALILA